MLYILFLILSGICFSQSPLSERYHTYEEIYSQLLEWETEFGRMNAEIKERFNKPTLETMLLCYDKIPNFNNPSISKDEIVKVLKNMNKNQSYYLGR